MGLCLGRDIGSHDKLCSSLVFRDPFESTRLHRIQSLAPNVVGYLPGTDDLPPVGAPNVRLVDRQRPSADHGGSPGLKSRCMIAMILAMSRSGSFCPRVRILDPGKGDD